jgi:hypothetical protein
LSLPPWKKKKFLPGQKKKCRHVAAVIQPFEAPQKMKKKKISGTTVKRERRERAPPLKITRFSKMKDYGCWLAGWPVSVCVQNTIWRRR